MTAGIPLIANDFVKIVYYPEVVVGETCSLKFPKGVCYAYPLENTIIIKANVSQSGTFAFTLTGMTNLYQYQGNNIYTEVWKYSTKRISNKFYTSYTVGTIYTDPTTSNPLAITF